tara:strand:+ start:724 stop:1197 length:474 start_codon:yes stop_codon:yes gene_type:complete
MKIKLILVGKTNSTYLIQGEKDYEKRLKHYCRFEELLILDIKNRGKLSEAELKNKEGQLVLSKLDNADYIVLLDENGKGYSSMEFAAFIQKKMLSSVKTLVFVVGGAFGFCDEVYQRANHKISLSKMTFSHQMVRLIFKEQLYRAFSILKGEKYHHE